MPVQVTPYQPANPLRALALGEQVNQGRARLAQNEVQLGLQKDRLDALAEKNKVDRQTAARQVFNEAIATAKDSDQAIQLLEYYTGIAPDPKAIETIRSLPAEAFGGAKAQGFTLGPNQTRFDAEGNQIAIGQAPIERTDKGKLVSVVGDDGEPVYMYEKDAVGRKPYIAEKASKPGTQELKDEKTFNRLDVAFSNYRNNLEQYGTEYLPGKDKRLLKSSYNDLLLELKELYALGVLNGPDIDIMNDVLNDPTALSSQLQSGADLIDVLDTVVGGKIKAAKDTFEQQYGRRPESSSPAESQTVTIGRATVTFND